MSFDPLKQEQLVEPYSKLAYIYDDIMYHVDYKAWSRYIHQIIQKWHPHAQKILDISCGTGNLLLKLNLKNYNLYGFDFSFDMVKIAKRKIKAKNVAIPLWQGDMISFGIRPKKVDVIISLYDSVNYIMNKSGWQKMLDCVYHGLNNDGLFIFDICTEKNSREYFHNYFEKKIGKDYYYTRESHYDSLSKIHSNQFVIHFNSEKATFLELHKQKILLLKEVINLIEQTNFQFLGVYHEFTFRSGTENSLRVHFVLKKKEEDDSIV